VRNGARTSLLMLALFLPAHSIFAQSQAASGEITGQVIDAAGGALPGATVTVANPKAGVTRSADTGPEGFYTIPLLPPGFYNVTGELAGFQTVKRSDVQVTVGSTLTVNFKMGVAGVAETVNVTGEGAFLETASNVKTATLDSAAIDTLPINGRRFQDFVTLTPTAQIDTSRQQISLSGQRGINANINIDGADYSQPFFGGIRGGERSNFAFTVPQEAIQEFQVVAAGYSAEFGRSSGGIVNAVTKSGSNDFKGSAFYLNRPKDLATKNAFGQDAAPTQQQFGGSFGGPLKQDKVFFFASYEQQKITDPRQVLFNIAGFQPNPATQEAFDYYTSLQTNFEDTNDARAILGRVDFALGGGDRLSFRYSHSSNEAKNATSVGNALTPSIPFSLSDNGTEKDSTDTVVGQYTHVVNTGLLLEARAQYSREDRPRLANALSPTVETNIGRFGTVSFLPNTEYDWRAQAAANLTWIKDKHTVKFGAEYGHLYVNQTFGFNQEGRFIVSGTDTATILDLLGAGGNIPNRFDSTSVTYSLQLGNLQADFPTNQAALFAQDAWRIRPGFTLDFGLRWEGDFNPTPVSNNDSLVNRIKGFVFPSGKTVDPTAPIPNHADQFGPRVGFSWDPMKDAKTVVRGFAGVYYATTPALIYAGPINNFRVPAGDLSATLPLAVPAGNPNNTVYKQFLLIGIDLNKTPLNNLPTLTPAQIQQIASALGLPFDPYVGASPVAVGNNFKNPRAIQLGLGAERQVGPGWSVGIEGSLVKTTRLERNYDVNLPIPAPQPGDPAQRPIFGLPGGGALRPIPSLGSVQIRESSAKSLFRAVSLSTRLQRTWGQLSAYYVLSKSESDDDNERDATGTSYENAYNLAPEYGPARLDRRHQFNGSMVFFLPHGFEASSSFRFLSGVPIDATIGTDVNGDRVNNDRPYSAPGVPFKRNAFRNLPFKEVNLRLQKGFKIGSRRRVVASAEFFNIFRFSNIQLNGSAVTNYCSNPAPKDCGFGPPTNVNFLQVNEQNPSSGTFGNYLLNNLPGVPREVQLGLRFQF